MTTVGRNQPCPCGSGKRYKECHGAFGSLGAAEPAATSATAAPSWVERTMRDALRAQRSGAGGEAARLYRDVLAADTSNFDATHMLALIEYERGHYETALALLKRAIELRPDVGTPRHNLRLLEAMPLIEIEICRDVLPRLAPRVDLDFQLAQLAAASSVQVVIGDMIASPERTALAQVVAACGTAPVTLWDEAAGEAVAGEAAALKLSTGNHPRDGLLVIFGTARSPAVWLRAVCAERVLLVVTRDEPCAIIDWIDELTAAGYNRPGLLCATGELAERLRLPRGASLPERNAAACVDS
jgi:hypothetical protein